MRLFSKQLLAIGLVIAFAVSPAVAQGDERIPKKAIVELFDQLRTSVPWYEEGPMLWGYYFTDKKKAKLSEAGEVLAEQGYHVVDIYRSGGIWWLQIEKVEFHTPDTLYERNAEFYDLAEEYGLLTYDGMDVGPLDK